MDGVLQTGNGFLISVKRIVNGQAAARFSSLLAIYEADRFSTFNLCRTCPEKHAERTERHRADPVITLPRIASISERFNLKHGHPRTFYAIETN